MKVYVADLETVVYDGQDSTEAWASGLVDIHADDATSSVLIHHSLKETLTFLVNQNENAVLYYHNLKFDGQFWLYYLIHDLHFKQAIEYIDEKTIERKDSRKLNNNEVSYVISSMGQWYNVKFKYHGLVFELRDSLKLLPFSVKEIGKGFKTKHQKLEMEYKGKRYAGCTITESEREYIANDILVVKEALNIMFSEGHTKLTIGGCCLSEFKKIIGDYDYKNFFPAMQDIKLVEEYDAKTVDEYIRASYHGGWCYRVDGDEIIYCDKGITADVNSLYPSMMHSQSGNRYPIGKPKFWKGNYIPKQAQQDNKYYFIRIRCRFKLKKNKLPFIQIKGNPFYKSTEMLKTSDIYNKKKDKYYSYWKDKDGVIHDTRLTMTMTMTDYTLFREHYDTKDFEILDGCYFGAVIGLFDEYIDKYKHIKMTSKGALRQIAKLFLNNLYGKLATSMISSFKYISDMNGDILHYRVQNEMNKEPVYIPIGSAITSYSRNFTIRAAQANYYGTDKHGFKYADTDSIHCDLPIEKIKGLRIDDNDFCAWKIEAFWDEAIFIRQKTYIEHVTHEDMKPVDEPYYNIKCAGMPQRCKELFELSLNDVDEEVLKKYSKAEQEFLKTKRTIKDFKYGLKIPGKLLPETIKGGVILTETEFTLRKI